MGPLILPLAVLLLAVGARRFESAVPPAPKPPQPQPPIQDLLKYFTDAPKPAAPAKTSAEWSGPHHAQPLPHDVGPMDAAVKAAVERAIKDDVAMLTQPTAAPQPQRALTARDDVADLRQVSVQPPELVRSPYYAAKDLAEFLRKTGRFGTMKDRPEQTKAAQRDLSVKDDGIVGPVTRAAAQRAGVTLPKLRLK